MTTIASLQNCIRCGEQLTSPDRCTYVDEEFVCYRWICAKCGCEFESSICLYQEAPPLAPVVIEAFLPSLLVA